MSRIATLATQIAAGTTGFAAVVQPVQDGIADLAQQVPQGLENPGNYVKGLVVSGIIQIVLRLIDKWSEKRKAKKAAREAELK